MHQYFISPKKSLTLDDTLRGTITPERAWWDLNYYHLDVMVQPEIKSLKGKEEIRYTVLQPSHVLQVDLQAPLQITDITQDGRNLSFTRKGNNAYFVTLAKQQEKGTVQSITVSYGGEPLEAENPPWQGGVQPLTVYVLSLFDVRSMTQYDLAARPFWDLSA